MWLLGAGYPSSLLRAKGHAGLWAAGVADTSHGGVLGPRSAPATTGVASSASSRPPGEASCVTRLSDSAASSGGNRGERGSIDSTAQPDVPLRAVEPKQSHDAGKHILGECVTKCNLKECPSKHQSCWGSQQHLIMTWIPYSSHVTKTNEQTDVKPRTENHP